MAASVEQICHFLSRIPPHILDQTRQQELVDVIYKCIHFSKDGGTGGDYHHSQKASLGAGGGGGLCANSRLRSASSATNDRGRACRNSVNDKKESSSKPPDSPEGTTTPPAEETVPQVVPPELFSVYADVIREIPHHYETKIGKLKCIVHTNSILSEVNICVIFLHGLGASPWHFIKVSSLFFETLDKRLFATTHVSPGDTHKPGFSSTDGAASMSIMTGLRRTPIKAAFIFPFAPNKMRPGEFGAVDDSIYGSYKWWDVVSSSNDECMTTSLRPFSPNRIFGSTTTDDYYDSNYPNRPPDQVSPSNLFFKESIKTPVLSFDQDTNKNHNNRSANSALRSSSSAAALEDLNWPHPMLFCCGKLSTPELVNVNPLITQKKEELSQLENPSGRMNAVYHILGLFKTLKRDYGLNMDRIAVSGFSQGAMLALDILHYIPSPPIMAGLFSAAPMCVQIWKSRLATLSAYQRRTFSSMPMLQSHGTNDWVFPLFVGRWLHRFLVRQRWSVRFIEFEGDHELPASVMNEFHRLLYNLASKTSQPIPSLEGFDLAVSINNGNDDNDNDDDDTIHEGMARTRSRSDSRPLWERFDDLMYKAGYALASCVLPVANRIC